MPHVARETLRSAQKPTQARVYDYLVGGRDNFEADRELAGDLIRRHPPVARLARVNRGFVLAAARWAAERGVRQFLDLGCGLPLRPALHEAARDGDPSARVVYVDRDTMVMSHVEALESGPGLAAVLADVADPAAVLACARMTGTVDLEQPVCAVLGATLSAMPADTARDAVAGYTAEMVPGSMVVISCASYEDRKLGAAMASAYSAAGPWYSHSRDEVAGFFGRLRVEGGQAADVRPWCWPLLQEPIAEASVIGGVGWLD